MSDPRTAGAVGNGVLVARKKLRSDLLHGRVTVADVLDDPAAFHVDRLLVTEMLRYIPGWDRARIERLARDAHAHGVNLIVRTGRAPLTTRYWLVDRVTVRWTGDERRHATLGSWRPTKRAQAVVLP